MNFEKQKKENQESVRELESHHFNQSDPLSVDGDFIRDNKVSLDRAKLLISLKQAKLVIDTDLIGLSRAKVFVENKDENKIKKEIIFLTNIPSEIEELADVAYSGAR